MVERLIKCDGNRLVIRLKHWLRVRPGIRDQDRLNMPHTFVSWMENAKKCPAHVTIEKHF